MCKCSSCDLAAITQYTHWAIGTNARPAGHQTVENADRRADVQEGQPAVQHEAVRQLGADGRLEGA